ncbi:432R [Invertebrate iridescent virus Kaz2018]|uniref:432R n=2 Tax=Iridovirus TaxID=10487 RepID=Q91F93_IIV6|nr:432R [Invertebrate iridescent virus 6]AAK82292.1 432R [Invertebrate iridescent virus 6]QMS79431.1 hypothetical protein IIV6-T1_424 [Invertebrate iridescent virus 6]QNH08842.1 432R [Invertebrate iridescent virus Kaz2018]
MNTALTSYFKQCFNLRSRTSDNNCCGFEVRPHIPPFTKIILSLLKNCLFSSNEIS